MNLREYFNAARRLSRHQWRLLVEAGTLLVLARLAVWFVPFRRLATHLGAEMTDSPAEIAEDQREEALSIGWAVRTLGRRLPGMGQCLVQAVAATRMLQRHCIPSTLYFGLAKKSHGGVKAHAWVRSGAQLVTGAEGHQDFRVVATFTQGVLD